MKALECSQHYISSLQIVKGRAGGGIWPKFKLIQVFMHILITCKNEEDSIKMKELRSCHNIFPIISLWGFFQTLKGARIAQSVARLASD